MINNVTLTGRLTRDAELRYTQNNVAIANTSIAVNRNFKNQNGDYEADFINLTAFRKTAELLANNLHKGSLIGVTGRIQTRNYENQQRQRVYVTEVVAENITFLDSKQDNTGYQKPNNNTGYSNNSASNAFGATHASDISDDDLPF